MSFELPRDAEGREIPLDTVVLFGGNGNVYNIVRWIYTTDFETWSETNTWRAITEKHRALDPELMYLKPPDSWEKLEEDLDRCIAGDNICLYFSPSGRCRDCANEQNGACDAKVFELVVKRIKRLRGEDDA